MQATKLADATAPVHGWVPVRAAWIVAVCEVPAQIVPPPETVAVGVVPPQVVVVIE